MDQDKPFFLPFIKKEKLTSDCYTFFFEKNSAAREFVPGQTYEMKLPHKNMDERGDDRVFTVSSSPTDDKFITITTRIIQSTFKLRLANLKPGESVQFMGPWDDLNFDPADTRAQVFLAGGIGVTPFHSIVNYCLDKKINTPMTLFVSWKNQDEMIFDDFFRKAEEKLENFSYVPTLTEDKSFDADIWDGERGRINGIMIKKYVLNIKEGKYFFAGPPAMVKALKQTITSLGVSKENLLFEEFEGY